MAILSNLIVRIAADTASFVRGLGDAEGSAARFGDRMQGIGAKMSVGLTTPLVAAGVATVKFASDAEEAASKMQAVFGPAAAEMNGWIERMQETIPASTRELQDMSSGIQDLLVPLGMTPGAARDMTKEIVKLSADLGSFNNIPTAEALERIRSGLVGQFEPLLKFGVALSAATVKAKALEMGLISEGQALDANARAQAAFALILEGTTAAHGDAARTADSTTNQFKFLKANLADTAVVLGIQLLPFVTQLAAGLSTVLKWVGQLDPAIVKLGIGIAAFAAAAGPLVGTLGTLLKILPALKAALVALTGPWGLVLAAAGLATAAFIAFRDSTDEAAQTTREFADELLSMPRNVAALVLAQHGLDASLLDNVKSAEELTAVLEYLTEVQKSHPQVIKAVTTATDNFAFSARQAARTLGNSNNIIEKLVDRHEELRAELAKLEFNRAFARKKDEAEQLEKHIAEVRQQLSDTNAVLDIIGRRTIDLVIQTKVLQPAVESSVLLAKNTANLISSMEAFNLMLSGETSTAVRDFFGELEAVNKKALPATASFLDQLGQAASKAGSFLVAAAQKFLGVVGGMFGSLISLFNPLAIVGTALDQAIRDATTSMNGQFQESIKHITTILVEALGPVLKALTPVFEALVPIIRDLAPVLSAVARIFAALFKAIAPILHALVPILRALFPVFKLLAIIATYMGQVFAKAAQIVLYVIGFFAKVVGTVIYAIGKAIDVLPFISGKSIMKAGKDIMKAGDEFKEAGDQMGIAFDELGKAREEIKKIELEPETFMEASSSIDNMRLSADDAGKALRDLGNSARGVNLGRNVAADGGGDTSGNTTGATVTSGGPSSLNMNVRVDAHGLVGDPHAVGTALARQLLPFLADELGREYRLERRTSGTLA